MDTTQNNYDEDILMLQLDGVLDFDAVKRAAQNGIVRVRNSSTENPLVQVSSYRFRGVKNHFSKNESRIEYTNTNTQKNTNIRIQITPLLQIYRSYLIYIYTVLSNPFRSVLLYTQANGLKL
jgi:hypothetical protein